MMIHGHSSIIGVTAHPSRLSQYGFPGDDTPFIQGFPNQNDQNVEEHSVFCLEIKCTAK